jgi:hypothetical protein
VKKNYLIVSWYGDNNDHYISSPSGGCTLEEAREIARKLIFERRATRIYISVIAEEVTLSAQINPYHEPA